MNTENRHVLKLTVNNHPGVMSHVCGLFARRAYNLEGIMVLPLEEDKSRSRIWLLVNEDDRLPQIMKQTHKLEDVLDIEEHDVNHSVFERLENFFHT